jgi:hypothetical protein
MRILSLWSAIPIALSLTLLSVTTLATYDQHQDTFGQNFRGQDATSQSVEGEFPDRAPRMRVSEAQFGERQGRRRGRPHPSSNVSYPNGLVVVIPAREHKEQSSLQALNNPFISGVAVQMNWRDIEPAEGQFDWSKLDELFAAADSGKKWVHLLIFPGFFAPAWAKAGVETDMFPIQYGPGKGTIESLPMPWDRVYLKRWLTFLKQVSERYGSSPAFRMIAANGPTSVSAEMTLPNHPQDHKKWLAHSYTVEKYLGAWREVLHFYDVTFPNQCVSLSAPGIPVLGPGRKRDPGERQRYRQAVVDQASNILGRRLAIQFSDLHAGHARVEAPDENGFVIDHSGGMITGLQMRCSCEGDSAVMGAEGNPPLALRRSIDKGLQPNNAGQHISYLEVYEPDVLAEEMQPVLKYGTSLFGN